MAELIERYIFLIVPAIAWLLGQVLKVLFYAILEKRINIAKLFDVGGMPSSHSALVVSLATIVGMKEGTNSPLFAVALFFALVVMYDATNLRRASGEHAQTLNRIIPELLHGKIIPPYEFKEFYEALGHSPFEVLVGTIFGFLVAWIIGSLAL